MSTQTFIASVTSQQGDFTEVELARVSIKHNVPRKDILARHRQGFVIRARHEYWARLYAKGLSYPAIGILVNRHHTSVMYGVKKHNAREAGK